MNRERFRFFRVVHHESDLMVGVSHQEFHPDMERVVKAEMIRLRRILLTYSLQDPGFFSSLDPLKALTNAPEEILSMIQCGQNTGTGPMAAVAGLFAQQAGREIVSSFGEMEVVVENGGDLYLQNKRELVSVIHAGESSLSDKMAFLVPPGEWGICTSSGTMGHSFSRGKADAVTVICASAPLADSWATAIANKITSRHLMGQELEAVAGIEEILGCAIIFESQIGIRGNLEVKLLSSEE